MSASRAAKCRTRKNLVLLDAGVLQTTIVRSIDRSSADHRRATDDTSTRASLRGRGVSRSASRARARCGLGAETRRTRCACVCTKKCDDRDSIAQPIERRATRNVDEGTLPRTGRVAFCSRARARCGPGAETIRTRCRANVCACSSRGVEKKHYRVVDRLGVTDSCDRLGITDFLNPVFRPIS